MVRRFQGAAELAATDETGDLDESDETTSVPVEMDDTGQGTDVEFEQPGDDIKEPFDPEKIDVQTRNPTVALLLARIKRGNIDLTPDFQRHSGIWRQTAQSRLIESLLLRIPLPTFYAAERESDRWTVVDGIQRLTTIAQFMAPGSVNGPPLVLKDLEYLTEYENHTYDDLPGRLQTRLEETELVVHLIRRGTPEQAMFNIFARINTGGLPLSHQELRHALIPGPARTLLAELAESRSFLKATSKSVARGRMADREMGLRFIAFRLFDPNNYSSDDLNDFLRRAMRQINELPEPRVAEIRRDFQRAMESAWRIFGQHSFRKQRRAQHGRNPINKALFEAVSVNLANRTEAQLDHLVANKAKVNESLIKLLVDPEFESAVSVGTGAVAKVRHRFAKIDELFAAYDGTK